MGQSMQGLRPIEPSSSRSSTARDEYIEISASVRSSNVRQASDGAYIEISDGKPTNSGEQSDSAYHQIGPAKPKVPSSPRPGLPPANDFSTDLARSLSSKRHLPPPIPPPVLPTSSLDGDVPAGGLIRSATQSKRRAPPPPPVKKEAVSCSRACVSDLRFAHACSVCLRRMCSRTARSAPMSSGASDRASSSRVIGSGRTYQHHLYKYLSHDLAPYSCV